MLDTLRQIAHGLAAQFGSNCEVVVHDLDPDRLDIMPGFVNLHHHCYSAFARGLSMKGYRQIF